MRKSFLIYFVLNIILVHAQSINGDKPLLFRNTQKSLVTRYNTKALNLKKVLSEDSIAFVQNQQFNVARLQKTDYRFNVSDNKKIRKSTFAQKSIINVPKAQKVALKFKHLFLPKGSQLFIYKEGQKSNFLVFDARNHDIDKSHFISQSVEGENIYIEYNQFEVAKQAPQIKIEGVINFYNKNLESNPGFGQSTECEVNIACPEGDYWCKEIQSVVRIFIQSGSSYSYCSGAIVNNTKQDYTPYILTAEHCGAYASDEDFNYWKFDFNYQSTQCKSPSSETEIHSQFIVGCQKIAQASRIGNQGSDFRLVKLLDSIPKAWGISYAGWNIADYNSISGGGVGIHQPYGDIKKISTFSKTLTSTDANGGSESDEYWETYWEETDNGFGITEAGSSGSPLFNSKGLIIGTLATGSSYCDNRKTSPDYYGKISKHWDSNGSDSTKQLKPWLDPIASGITELSTLSSNTNVDCGKQLSFDDFVIYPSPASQIVYIGNNDLSVLSEALFELYDIYGRLIYSEKTSPSIGIKQINISSFSNGVYILRVTKPNWEIQQKFIILQ